MRALLELFDARWRVFKISDRMREMRRGVGRNRGPLNNRFAWRTGYLVASLGIYLTDQASKAWAIHRVRFEDRTVISGLLDFVYAENRGIAFGQLQEGGAFGRWFFVVLAAAAAIA